MQKRKRFLACLGVLFFVFSVLSTLAPLAYREEEAVRAPLDPALSLPDATNSADRLSAPVSVGLRGVWVSSVYNLDFPSKSGLTAAQLKAEADKILDGALELGFNAIFLQVRPTSDALYASEVYPWSSWLSGTQGKAPADNFDPLSYWVEAAHRRGLQLHAWVNPLRVTVANKTKPNHDLSKLSENHPARLHPDWVVKHSDGGIYFNPGLPEVRDLILRGITEIVENYNVDGVHFDDYFYPGQDFADDATYKTHGKDFSNVGDWRRDNINRLIRDTHAAVKEVKSTARFGVSPFAVWANKSAHPQGSNTRSFQSYFEQYADTRSWVKNNWVDYICPQIYWHIGNETSDYETLLNWWTDVVSGTKVDLYIGMAAYRTGTGEKPTDAWYGTGELVRQLMRNEREPLVKGYVMFRWVSFAESPALAAAVANYTHTSPWLIEDVSVEAFMQLPSALGTLGVGRPSSDTTTALKQYYVLGTSDPNQPLYCNGTLITERSQLGAFGLFVTLAQGKNVLTFTQGEVTVTRTITKTGASSVSSVKFSGVPGQGDALEDAGVLLDETAATVTDGDIPIDENIVPDNENPLSDANETDAANGTRLEPVLGGAFASTYTAPFSPSTRRFTIQFPVPRTVPPAKAEADSFTVARTFTAPVAASYAEVTAKNAPVFAGASSTGGPITELARGQKDVIVDTSKDGAWIKLSVGGWIQKSDISRKTGTLTNTLSAARYTVGEKWDKLDFTGTNLSATKIDYDGKKLTLSITCISGKAPALSLPDNALFSTTGVSTDGGRAVYTMYLNDGQRLDGYYVSAEGKTLTLNVKRPFVAKDKDRPLSGMLVVLDPGHGGSDSGALGPLGTKKPEKTLNLENARLLRDKLTRYGAKVIMTRETDVALTLSERQEFNRTVRPDLFLSVHGNSLDESVNAAAIDGFSVWYRNRNAKDFAQSVYDGTFETIDRGKRGCNQSNLYVCRPTWTPSFLLEMGFLCNPGEFEWLVNPFEQNRMADAVARAIVGYLTAG